MDEKIFLVRIRDSVYEITVWRAEEDNETKVFFDSNKPLFCHADFCEREFGFEPPAFSSLSKAAEWLKGVF